MSLKIVAKFIFLSIQILLAAGSINENIIDTGCHSSSECKEFEKVEQVSNATCFNHKCLCTDSDKKIIECLPDTQGFSNVIGGKCPCTSIKWSTCVNGFCMCSPNYTASEDSRSCIAKKVPIGSYCEYDVQCSKETTFATCSNHICSCKANFTFYNGTCQSLVDVGKECESEDKCPKVPNMRCESQQCFCASGYVAKFDKTACLPNADYGDNCSESGQCQQKVGEGAVCEQGRCICDEDFQTVTFKVDNETKSICEDRIAIGQACAYDTDCFPSRYNGTEQSMYCFLKECQCAQDFEQDMAQRFCVKSKPNERQNTWLDSIMLKVSSTFAASSSGNRNKSIIPSIAIVSIVSIILFV